MNTGARRNKGHVGLGVCQARTQLGLGCRNKEGIGRGEQSKLVKVLTHVEAARTRLDFWHKVAMVPIFRDDEASQR